MRDQSKISTNEKENSIMDVNQQATDKAFSDNHVDRIIHGHTHRPAIHHKSVDGHDTTRVVLGDWFKKGSYLRVKDASEYKLQTFE
jgi:UDP-2,3-diacylglucosamine hydrolase